MSTDPTNTRSVTLVGHAGDGKTTLADGIAMAAGVTTRLGSVDEGTSFMNHLAEERARRVTISTGIASFTHGGGTCTLLDAPGDANFGGELPGAISASDAGFLVVSAQDGCRIGTEKAYKLARERGLALIAFVNKMDTDRANFAEATSQLEERLGTRVVKLQLPFAAGADFSGFVDLLTRRAHTFALDDSGTETVGDVPDDLADDVETARMEMVEAAAEADDEILEKYLEEGELSTEEIVATLRKGVRAGSILPVLCGAAARNIGGKAALEVVHSLFPSPLDAARAKATKGEETIEIEPNPSGPVVAHVFKSIADRYAGMLSIFRVYSGTLTTDMTIVNSRSGSKERISKLLRISGDSTEDTKEVGPGEIAAVPKLKGTHTFDTLCDAKHVMTVECARPPRGVISFAVEAANKGDEDKVFESLNRLVEEDPSLALGRDERTGDFLLTGLGQLHIEVTLDKLRRLFKVEVNLKPPKVPYMETIRGRAENVEGKLKKQSGGRGQFGVCFLTVEPGERGSGVQFLDEIVGGAIPRQFIPAVEKGVRETCERGIIAGYRVTDIQVHCIDGKYHSVDSSEMAFKTAASMGIKAAFAHAKPVLLEPIMKMEVAVPDDYVGDVMGNLNSRRGRVAGVEARGSMQSIGAEVPMSEVLTYASDLTSITGGQGAFTMEFSHYEEVPKEIQDKIVAEAAAEKDDD